MGIESRLRDSLSIERAYDTGAVDEYGHTIREWRELAVVQGLIQPASAREVALSSQAGAAVTEFIGFLLPTDLTAADRIRNLSDPALAPDDRFQLTGRPRDAGGLRHHYEVPLRLVKSDDPPLPPGS